MRFQEQVIALLEDFQNLDRNPDEAKLVLEFFEFFNSEWDINFYPEAISLWRISFNERKVSGLVPLSWKEMEIYMAWVSNIIFPTCIEDDVVRYTYREMVKTYYREIPLNDYNRF